MAKFNVTITETLKRTVEVEATNGIDAVDEARRMYHEEDIVLDADNFTSVDFLVEGPLVK